MRQTLPRIKVLGYQHTNFMIFTANLMNEQMQLFSGLYISISLNGYSDFFTSDMFLMNTNITRKINEMKHVEFFAGDTFI